MKTAAEQAAQTRQLDELRAKALAGNACGKVGRVRGSSGGEGESGEASVQAAAVEGLRAATAAQEEARIATAALWRRR